MTSPNEEHMRRESVQLKKSEDDKKQILDTIMQRSRIARSRPLPSSLRLKGHGALLHRARAALAVRAAAAGGLALAGGSACWKHEG